jgi:hypothetical protein
VHTLLSVTFGPERPEDVSLPDILYFLSFRGLFEQFGDLSGRPSRLHTRLWRWPPLALLLLYTPIPLQFTRPVQRKLDLP